MDKRRWNRQILQYNSLLENTACSVMESLSKRYESICNEYLDLFCKKHEVYHTGWIGNQAGGIIEISDAFFNFDDIRLDIDLDALKEEKAVFGIGIGAILIRNK